MFLLLSTSLTDAAVGASECSLGVLVRSGLHHLHSGLPRPDESSCGGHALGPAWMKRMETQCLGPFWNDKGFAFIGLHWFEFAHLFFRPDFILLFQLKIPILKNIFWGPKPVCSLSGCFTAAIKKIDFWGTWAPWGPRGSHGAQAVRPAGSLDIVLFQS